MAMSTNGRGGAWSLSTRGLFEDARGRPRSRGPDRSQPRAERAGYPFIADSAKKEGSLRACGLAGRQIRIDLELSLSRLFSFSNSSVRSPPPKHPPSLFFFSNHHHSPPPASARPAAAPAPSPAPARAGATRPLTRPRDAAAAEARCARPATTAAEAGARCRSRGGCTSRGAPGPMTGGEMLLASSLSVSLEKRERERQ